ncbi:hypothetical protein D9M71_699120 [compost metagenome]
MARHFHGRLGLDKLRLTAIEAGLGFVYVGNADIAQLELLARAVQLTGVGRVQLGDRCNRVLAVQHIEVSGCQSQQQVLSGRLETTCCGIDLQFSLAVLGPALQAHHRLHQLHAVAKAAPVRFQLAV